MTYDPANCPERLGKLTASKAAVIMGGLDTAGLASYVKALAWERVFGSREPEWQSDAMRRGQELEADALDWYEFGGLEITKRTPGLITHPELPTVAASPDAIGAGRVIEVKCPLFSAWMDIRAAMQIPAEYRWQVRWQMWCAGVSHVDFVAYHPQPGGILLCDELRPEHVDAMRERVPVIEQRIARWVEILTSKGPQS